MKLGLLIQGPLLSIGRSGKTGKIKAEEVKNEHIVHYDCRKNIDSLVNNYSKLFSEIVLSTWDDGTFTDYSNEKIRIIRVSDKTKQLPNKNAKNEFTKVNNMNRQFLGTYTGLEQFDDVDFIVKIRTDQYIDLSLIVERVNTFRKNRVLVAYIPKHEYLLPDFYFAGEIQVLKEYFKILAYEEKCFSLSPHKQTVLAPAYKLFIDDIKVKKYVYEHENTCLNNYVFKYMFTNYFDPLPESLYSSLIWRGQPLCDDFLNELSNLNFSEDYIYQVNKRYIPHFLDYRIQLYKQTKSAEMMRKVLRKLRFREK